MARPSSPSPPQSDAPAHQDSPKEQLSSADPFREENSGINGEDRLSVGARHYGCAHYKRRCRIRAPCCNEIFDCRHCHNEIKNRNEKDPLKRHDVPRHLVQKVICSLCQHEQDVKQVCENCAVSMGDYFCSKCKFFDDETEKNQYHCDSCGICRIGGRENYFHCDRCANIMIDLSCHFRNSCSYGPGMRFCKWYLVNNDCDRPLGVCPTPCFTSSSFPGSCYTVALQNGHPCVEKSMHHNCPICFEYLFDSVMDIAVLRCGHTMHKHCQTEMQKHHQFACPICSKSVVDMSMVWRQLDSEILLTPMPEEYQDKMVWILCNDCGGASEVRYHIVGQKCSTSTCGSYNTRSISRPHTANSRDQLGPTL